MPLFKSFVFNKPFNLSLIWIIVASFPVSATPKQDQIFTQIPTLYGKAANDTVLAWKTLILQHQNQSVSLQLEHVNDFFNRNIRIDSDKNIWMEEDYWAGPLEMMLQRRGDSKDIALAKYCSLVSLGIAKDQLRLVYVSHQLSAVRFEPHMVVAYYPTLADEPLILDTTQDKIAPASQRSELLPVFSFNTDGYWQDVSTTSFKQSRHLQHSHWRQAFQKAHAEGICL